jgi:phospholipid transport system substrate-binding protein
MVNRLVKNLTSLAAILAVAAGLVSNGATFANEDPAALIDETVQSLFGEFSKRRAELEGNSKELYELVERVASPIFDFDYISRLVLAKSWKKANDQQRREFSDEFRRLMVVTYATALFRYTGNETMTFGDTTMKEVKSRQFAAVNTEVVIGDGPPVSVVYSLILNESNQWKIYNLTVGSLNMVLNYRNVIQSTIHSEGLDGMIASIKDNNDKNYN